MFEVIFGRWYSAYNLSLPNQVANDLFQVLRDGRKKLEYVSSGSRAYKKKQPKNLSSY